jgi:phosphatidylinositol phospholipase C delta
MSLSLAALIVYTVGVKWRGLNKKEQYGASHIISLGERRALKTIKEAKTDLVAHCRTHIVRAYPAGTRFTSSNYSPLPLWAAGIQMVALNWQTYDLGAELNTAMFQRNGRSGYVLKPEFLRVKRSGEKDKEALARVERYILTVQVLSAQQLPRPRRAVDNEEDGEGALHPHSVMNPFVEVAVHTPNVAPDDVLKYTTAVVHGNGFNPVFDSTYQIPLSVSPDMLDLAFLRLEVMIKLPGGDDLSLGKYTVSLPVLMPGYRHVPLHDHLGQQYLFSSLFIYTQLEKQ